jgi:phosphatidylglycerophosphate synthase
MIDKWLEKSKLKDIITKFAEKFLLEKISANKLTLIGLILGILCAFFIFLSGLLAQQLLLFIIIAAILMTLSFFFDVLDGAVARLEKPSLFGGILDIFCDRTVEILIIIALVSTDPANLLWPGLFSLGAIILCITIFLASGSAIRLKTSQNSQKVIYYARGVMERGETYLFLFLITILVVFRAILFYVFAILIVITTLQRLTEAYHKLYSKNE